MRKLLIILALVLAGCATKPQATPVAKIPVSVPCEVEDPAMPVLKYQPPYEDIFVATKHLLGDREAQEAYTKELKVALAACKKR